MVKRRLLFGTAVIALGMAGCSAQCAVHISTFLLRRYARKFMA